MSRVFCSVWLLGFFGGLVFMVEHGELVLDVLVSCKNIFASFYQELWNSKLMRIDTLHKNFKKIHVVNSDKC